MFSYARALSLVVLALAPVVTPLLAVPAEAAESGSASFRNTRSAVNAGGRRKTSASFREDGTAGDIAKSTRTSASFLGREGLQTGYHYPARVTDLFASSAAASTEVFLQWTTPGNDGLENSTPGAYVVRYSSIASESPALSDAKFNAASVVTPAPPAAQVRGSRLTMNVSGLRAGVTYYFAVKAAERDGTRSMLSAGATAQTLPPLGCALVRNVHKVDGPYTTIQSAVDSLPSTLSGYACVIIRDGAAYNEQVWVRNFVNNGSSISIMGDPASGLRPVVAPPAASTAAFLVHNASVNVMGLDVVASQNVPFGISASSGYVTISSVSVSTSGSLGIYTAGVRISSWSALSYSTVAVWNADGVWLDGSTMTVVSYSSAATNNSLFYAVHLLGADRNTVTGSYIHNPAGNGARLEGGSDYNTISQSTMVSGAASYRALFLSASDSNTVTGSYMQNLAGYGARLNSGSDYNTISQSTMISNAASYSALSLLGSRYNTVTGSYMRNPAGYGAVLDGGSDHNIINLSTMTSAAVTAGRYALYITVSSSNTILGSYIQGSTGAFITGSTGTVIGGTVLVATNTAGAALALAGGSVNLTVATSTLRGLSLGRGLALNLDNVGVVSLGSVTFSGAARGIEISTQAAGFSLAVDSVTFRALAPGATAVHFLGGTFVTTMTLANFEDATTGANVSGAALALTSRVTMRAHRGARDGPVHENDPNSLVDWTGYQPYPGCVATSNVGAGMPYATISAGVAALPVSLPGHACVVIRDGATYAEQVEVRNFTMNGSSISIFTDPAVGSRAAVAPPAGSTAAFVIANASVNLTNVDVVPTQPVQYGVLSSSELVRLSTVNVDAPSLVWGAGIAVSSRATVSYSSVTVGLAHAYRVDGSSTLLSYDHALSSGAGFAAVYLPGASYSTFTVLVASNPTGHGLLLDFGARYNYVSYSTITVVSSAGNALRIVGSSYNVVAQSLILNPAGYAASIRAWSSSNTITGTTSRGATGTRGGLFIATATYNTIVDSFLENPQGHGAVLFSDADYNTIDRSTVTGASNGGTGVFFTGRQSSNTITRSYVYCNACHGVYLDQNASYNTVSLSTLVSRGAGDRYPLRLLGGSSFNSFARLTIVNDIAGGVVATGQANSNRVELSTIVTGGAGVNAYGILLNTVSSWTFSGNYVQGTTGAYVTRSTGSVFAGNVIVSSANAVYMTVGSVDLTLTSNTLVALPGASGGVLLDPGTSGDVILATNTIRSGHLYGVRVGTRTAGATVWIGSNTVEVTPNAVSDAYGLLFDGLMTGATVTNNALVVRAAGSMGAGTAYGLYARSAAGLVVERNRLSNPGLVTAGSFEALRLDDADGAVVRYNDFHSTGTGLSNMHLVRLVNGSTGAVFKNNVLFSSFTVTGASATLALDAASQAGFVADYNDYFSSHSVLSFEWGATAASGLAGWQAASGKDANSLSAHPQWRDPGAGVEDFHPRSSTGRYDPATQSFVNDGSDSPAIDKADPADDYSLETAPNGARANLGSYGGTAEASRSPSPPYPGCVVTNNVGAGQAYATISAGVNALPATLTGHSCVVIRDAATYAEQVTVEGFANNGSSISILTDPAAGSRAVVDPPAASTAAFLVKNASVNVLGIDVKPTVEPVAYGVYASSSYVKVSSVNVDGGASVWTAGVRVSSHWARIEYSSVSAGAALALWLQGSTGTVRWSSATSASGALSVQHDGWGWTLSDFLLRAQSSAGLQDYGNGLAVQRSTLATTGAGAGVTLSGFDFSLSESYVQGTSGLGISGSPDRASIDRSTVIGTGSTGLRPPSRSTVTYSFVQARFFYGLSLFPSSDSVVRFSTIVSLDSGSNGVGAKFNGGQRITLEHCYVQGSSAVVVGGSGDVRVASSRLAATRAGSAALHVTGAGSFNVWAASNTLMAPAQGGGAHVDGANGLVSVSSSVISGGLYGVSVATQASGARVWVTSNAISVPVDAGFDTFGIRLDGLQTGATIQDNSVYHRTSGGMGAGTSYAFHARSSSGVVVDHNRFNNPGMVTAGSFTGFHLDDADKVMIFNNDLHSSGTALTNAYLVRLVNGSTGVQLYNNVVASSFGVTGTSATIAVDAASQSGFFSDYNLAFSLNGSKSGLWGTASLSMLDGTWMAVTGNDRNSVGYPNPRWTSLSAGAEDFHPRSRNGRWDPAAQAFVNDAVDSEALDAGRPQDSFALETSPNGGRVNAGSYGGTAEASRSQAYPCATVRRVQQNGGPWTDVTGALSSIWPSLSGHTCVVILDAATYPEQVAVEGFTNNGSSLTIMADSYQALRPVVDPPSASTAAFLLRNASVNVSGIDIRPNDEAVDATYGIWASSSYVRVSSVNIDAGGSPADKLTLAGVRLSSWSAVSYSSVTVGAAHGVWLDGSTMTAVSYSSAVNNSLGRNAFWLTGASSNTFTVVFASNSAGNGMLLEKRADDNVVSYSTVTGSSWSGLYVEYSSRNVFSHSYFYSRAGTAAELFVTDGHVIADSTMTARTAGKYALNVRGSSNTIVRSLMTNPQGYGLELFVGSYSLVADSTMTAGGSGYSPAFGIVSGTSNTVSRCYISNPNSIGISLDTADNTVIHDSTGIGGGGWFGLYYNGGSSNTATRMYLYAAGGVALEVDDEWYSSVYDSTVTADYVGGALYVFRGSYNQFRRLSVSNVSGPAVSINALQAVGNVLAFSTITSLAAGSAALEFVSAGSNTVASSYIQGSTAAHVSGSTGTVFTGVVLVATNTAGYALRASKGVVNLSVTTTTLLGGAQGAGLALEEGARGVVSLSSVVVTQAARGVMLSTPSAGFSLAVDSVTFRSLAAGATAVHFLGGTFVATVTAASFEDASIGADVSGAALDLASRVTMRGHYGARTGPVYENDPNGLVDWEGYESYPGCAVTNNVGAGKPYATISAGVAALPVSLPGHACVVIRDGATYAEQVTVRNFTMNGSSISIFTDPAVGSRAVVDPPPASTAAFLIANASVNVSGISAVVDQNIPYGVWASSAYVSLSSVSVSTSGSLGIYEAGVRISSWSAVSYSTITVWNAHGVWLSGSTMTVVSYSTAVTQNISFSALYLSGADSNTVTGSYVQNMAGSGVRLENGADYNTVSMSTMVSNDPSGTGAALYLNASDSNTVTGSYIWNVFGDAAFLESGSDYNAISLSTMLANGTNRSALHLSASDGNTVSGSYISNPGGDAAWLAAGSDYNAISQSTMVTSHSSYRALYLNGADSNTVSGSYISNPAGYGAVLDGGADYNAISLSTMVSNAASRLALYLNAADGNTVTGSYIQNLTDYAAGLVGGSDYNAISQSTMVSSGAGSGALYLNASDSNTVTGSSMRSPAGYGAYLDVGSDYNTISQSTMVSSAGAYYALFLIASDSNTVTGSYVQNLAGFGAYLQSGSDYNTISQSTMISDGGGYSALYLSSSDSNTVTGSYMRSLTGYGARLEFAADFNVISLSTMIGDGTDRYGLSIDKSSGTMVFNAYVSGSTGAYISGSTGTVIGGTVLVATNTAGSALAWAAGAKDLRVATSTLRAPSLGRGLALNPGNEGVVSLGSVTFSGAARGVEASTQGASFSLAVDSITFRSLASGATAIHFLGGTFVSTITLADFEDATTGANVSGAALALASRVTMKAFRGPRGGPAYENDANSLVDWEGYEPYPGCAVTNNVGAGKPYATISAGVAALPVSLPGHACVVIRDAATYAEQVTVEGFANNGSSISIFTDPAVGARAVVDPPAASTAAFFVMNASVNVYAIDVKPTVETAQFGVFASSAYVQVSSVNVDGGASLWGAGVRVSSRSSISHSSVTVTGSANAYSLYFGTKSAVSYSTGVAAGGAAVSVVGGSSHTFTMVLASGAATAFYISSSNDNVIDLSTGNGAGAAFSIDGSRNLVTRSYGESADGYGLNFVSLGGSNVVSLSTFTTLRTGWWALYINSPSNSVSRSMILAPRSTGVRFSNNGDNSSITLSTITANAGGVGSNAVEFRQANNSSVTGSYIHNAGGDGVYFYFGTSNDTVSGSTVVSGGVGAAAVRFDQGSNNRVTDSVLLSTAGHAARFTGTASLSLLARSTAATTADFPAVLMSGSSNSVVSSYIQGSSAVVVSAATGAWVGSSVLVATNTAGAALRLGDHSINLTLTSSTLRVEPGAYGLLVSTGGTGRLIVSSNTFAGARAAVYVSTQLAGAELWLTSNTVVVPPSSSFDTAGLFFDGLQTGATVEHNAIVVRQSGSMGAFTLRGLHIRSSRGLVISRNRVSDPGMVTGGSVEMLLLDDADDVEYGTGDTFATGTGLTNAYLLRAANASTGLRMSGSIFFSSFTVTGASAVVAMDGASPLAYSDYNDYFSSNSLLSFMYAGAAYQGLAGWRAATGQESASISAHPQWFDPSAGVEDFHPRSTAGRWNGAAFVDDGTDSPTIDAADPAEDYSLETAPNGGRMNQGSYGGTAEASRTGNIAYPGCAVTRNVGAGQTYASISAGVAALPVSLPGHACVVIRDAATYAEQVTVQNFTMNGSSISIFTDPAVGASAVVAPNTTASTGAFVVANASINVTNLTVRPSAAVQYGVFASSSYVRVSSVGVDAPSLVWGAGVRLSSWSAVSYTSVTVGAAHGFWLDASTSSVVSYSTAANNSATLHAVFLDGGKNNSLAGLLADNAAGDALYLRDSDTNTVTLSRFAGGSRGAFMTTGSDYNAVSLSTMTGAANFGFLAFGASSNTVSQSYMSGGSAGAYFNTGADYNRIALSTMIGGTEGFTNPGGGWATVTQSFMRGGTGARVAGGFTVISVSTMIGQTQNALLINGADDAVVTQSYMWGAQSGALIGAGSDRNVVSLSTMISSNASAPALQVQGSSNTVAASLIRGSTAAVVSASTGTVIDSCVVVATNTAGSAVALGGGSVNLTVTSTTLTAPASGRGLYLDAGSRGEVRVGSVTVSGAARGVEIATQAAGFLLAVDSITFRSLASGATAIHFLGGTFVSTVTLAHFEDATTAVNVSGAALDLASRVTMRAPRGPLMGPSFENDPNSLVDWPELAAPGGVSLWYVALSSAGLQYATVGADGYTVQTSSRSDFQAGTVISSTVFGTQDRLSALPLMPNTTYFLRAGSLWGGSTVYAQTVVSTSTLADLASGTTVYSIHLTSMVVNWVGLPSSPPDASSKTAEGYILQASSMATFSPLWSSSFTPNVALSTLTIDGLRGGVTYYFRVGTLNHNSVPNWASAVSTLMPVQLGVELTTHTISVPGLVNMNSTVLITTSVVVTNTGNVKETYWVRATTISLGSPWRIGATQALDRYVLSMLINGAEPALGDFGAEDRLADAEQACTSLVFAFGGDCVQLPVGATRTLWFRLDTPTVTSTAASQDIRIFVRAVRDPDPDPNP